MVGLTSVLLCRPLGPARRADRRRAPFRRTSPTPTRPATSAPRSRSRRARNLAPAPASKSPASAAPPIAFSPPRATSPPPPRGSASARADLLSRAQSNFGDPASDILHVRACWTSIWSALTELGVDPASSLRRVDAVSALQSTYSPKSTASASSLQELIAEADQRIADAVSEAQSLMDRIAELNDEIRLNKRTGADSSAAENAQSALIDRTVRN